MRGKWGLVLFFKDTFAIFPPFPGIILNCAKKLSGCVPAGSFFRCHQESHWCPRDLSVGFLLCDLPPGQHLPCCPTAAFPPEWHKDVQLHLPGGTGAPEHMQMISSAGKEKKKKEGKTFHSILVIYSLLSKSQIFPKKVNSFYENFLLIANHVFSKTSESTVLCLSHFRPFKGGDL